MIHTHLQHLIVRELDLHMFDGGVHQNMTIEFLWASELRYHFGFLIVVIVKTDKDYKFAIMKPPHGVTYGGNWRLKSKLDFVTKQTWKHDLISELSKINIIPIDVTDRMSTNSFECYISVRTLHLWSDYKLMGPVDDPTLMNFWHRLLTIVRDIADEYETSEMENFVVYMDEEILSTLR